MSKKQTCGACGKGSYRFGNGLYDYYSCGHAWQKPLTCETGRWRKYDPYKRFSSKIDMKDLG